MIKDALSVVPARPAFLVAPLIVVFVLVFYYWDMYSRCTSVRQYRAALNEYLQVHDASARFRLLEFTDFNWDTVKILSNLKPGEKSVECPFGWNWASGERDALIAKGLLGAMIFGYRGEIVQYLELRGDEVAFRGTDSSLAPRFAVFDIGVSSSENPGVTLTLATTPGG